MTVNFIILGAQKSASTFVHYCIRSHPDVWMPREEIPAFESPDFENGAVDRLRARVAGISKSVIGIKRPNYLCSEAVPARIAREIGRPRFLVVLRDPIERLRSAYFHYVNGGFLPAVPLNEGVDAVLRNEFDRSWGRATELVRFSMYGEGLERYLGTFPRDCFMITTHEAVKVDPKGVLAQLCSFLRIPTDIPLTGVGDRPQSVIYSLRRLKAMQWKNTLVHRYNEDRTRVEYRRPKRLWRSVAWVLRHAEALTLGTVMRSGEKPQFSPEVRERLRQIFVPDIELTERLTGFDLSSWK